MKNKLFSLWFNTKAVVIRLAVKLYELVCAFVFAVKRDFPSWAIDAKAAVRVLATFLFGGIPMLILGWLVGTIEQNPQAHAALAPNVYYERLLLWSAGVATLKYWLIAIAAFLVLSVGVAGWRAWHQRRTAKRADDVVTVLHYLVSTFGCKAVVSTSLFMIGALCPDPKHPSAAGMTLLFLMVVVGFYVLYVMDATVPKQRGTARKAAKRLLIWFKSL